MVLVCFGGARKDGVGITVVGYHDVLITTSTVNGKPTGVICVESTCVLNTDEQFVRIDLEKGSLVFRLRPQRHLWGSRFRLPYPLMHLDHVALDGSISGWKIFGRIIVREPWP